MSDAVDKMPSQLDLLLHADISPSCLAGYSSWTTPLVINARCSRDIVNAIFIRPLSFLFGILCQILIFFILRSLREKKRLKLFSILLKKQLPFHQPIRNRAIIHWQTEHWRQHWMKLSVPVSEWVRKDEI